jgi:hypothetical protein
MAGERIDGLLLLELPKFNSPKLEGSNPDEPLNSSIMD